MRLAAASALVVLVGGCGAPGQAPDRPVDHGNLVLVSHGKPIYPIEMANASIQGPVVVDCAVATEGTSHDCRIVRSINEGFDAAALASARSAVYRAGSPGALPTDHHETTLTWRISR